MITDSRNTKTVLRSIFRYYGSEVSALKDSYGNCLGSRQFCPLPLNSSQVFASTKVRIPFCKKDGATGYFNICAVEKLCAVESEKEKDPVKTIIVLEGNHQIRSHYSLKNVKRSISLGHAVWERYCLLHNPDALRLRTARHKPASPETINFRKNLIFKLVTDDDDGEEDDSGSNILSN